jgi:hypothetical protein
MKKRLLIYLICYGASLCAQKNELYEKIVRVTVDAINNQNGALLAPWLAEDFSIAGQKGEMAKTVLNMLMLQLKDSVIRYEETSSKEHDGKQLTYDFIYKNKGKRTATFTFNKSDQLVELELFKMEVKKMGAETLKFETPTNDIIKVPFKEVGHLILVNVEIDGAPKQFLVDNGAPKIILNSKHFKTKEAENSTGTMRGVNGNVGNISLYKAQSFNWAGLKLNDQTFLAMELSHLEKQLKTTIHGLIGYEAIKEFDVLFDYKAHVLTLLKPSKSLNYIKDSIKKSPMQELALLQEAHLLVVPIQIGAKTYNMGIDCGAETNLLDEAHFPIVKPYLKNKRKTFLGGADKEKRKVQSGKLKSLTLGNSFYTKQRTVFNNMQHLNEGYKLHLDGLIGYTVLSKQLTLISYVHKTLYLF